jgi:cytochrome c-type biogenesis protein CcmH
MFWMICVALAGMVAIAIAAPLLRRPDAATESPAAAYDLRVYRDQLRDVKRDQERGVIDAADAERLRVEIGRKILAADRLLQAPDATRRGAGAGVALAILGLLLAGAFLVYHRLGHPDRPDEPIAQRIADAQARYDARPSQAEAETRAPASPKRRFSAEDMALIERLRQTADLHPDDLQGQQLLARYEQSLGDLVAAKQAQQRVLEIKGDKATAQDYADLADLTARAAGGIITAEAEAAIEHAGEIDPENPQARFLAGFLQIQNGRPDRAFPIWASLLTKENRAQPWYEFVRGGMGDLAWFAGQPDYTPPEEPALPGPDMDAMAAAGAMTPQDRHAMVEGMVRGLEERLASEGGSPEEWARLIGALAVLEQKERANAILAEARSRFGRTPGALATVNAAAEKAGLE